MELPQSGKVIQTAVLNVTDVVKAKSQPGYNTKKMTDQMTFGAFARELKTQLKVKMFGDVCLLVCCCGTTDTG